MTLQVSPEESRYLREVIQRDSSIVLEPSKDYLLETRLGPVMRAHDIGSFAELVGEVRRSPSGALRAAVVEAMTTNETSFFRDIHPWETLRTDLLPPMIEAQAATRQLTFVCAACSSGQEPYTIAMVLHEYFPQIATSWQIRILANDLSNEMIERTKAGVFSQIEVGRGLPSPLLTKYFARKGMKWQARDDLRSMIHAAPGNLAHNEAWATLPLVDAIFLRNVLIYFNQETKSTILRLAHGRLKPSGLLMLGSSETTIGLDNRFEREQVGRTVIYRPHVAGRPAPDRSAALAAAAPSVNPPNRLPNLTAPATPTRSLAGSVSAAAPTPRPLGAPRS